MEICPTILYILYIFKWAQLHSLAYILKMHLDIVNAIFIKLVMFIGIAMINNDFYNSSYG